MSDVFSGRLPATEMEQAPRFLPPAVAQDLTSRIAEVLLFARARGLDSDAMAARVVTFVAPMVADLYRQVAEAGAALSTLVDEFNRLHEIATRRAGVAYRLREELAAALVDAERFRTLTEQRCPIGAHTGWFAPSNGVQHRCPWCQILELGGYVGHIEHVLAAGPLDGDPDHREPDERDPDDVSAETLCDLLSLVGVVVAEGQVSGWPVEERRAATRWASATHLSASDNDVDVPTRPAFLATEPAPGVCPVHGPHPHAQLKCLDCPECTGGTS